MEVYESPLHSLMSGSWVQPGHMFDGYDLTLKMKQNLPKNKHELAAILIKDTLAEGDVESTRIQGIMKKYGIGSKTMQETKERLGVTSYRKMRKWYWHMEKETTDDLIGDGSND